MLLLTITGDSMAAGQAWGQKLGEKVMQRLKEKGSSARLLSGAKEHQRIG